MAEEDRYDDITISGKSPWKRTGKKDKVSLNVDDYFNDCGVDSKSENNAKSDSKLEHKISTLQVSDNKTPERKSPSSPAKKTKLKDKFKGKGLSFKPITPDEVDVGNNVDVIDPKPLPYQPTNLDMTIRLTSGEKTYDVGTDDFQYEENLGRGAYGVVDKMRHQESDTVVAVKRLAYSLESSDYKSLLMDLNVSLRTGHCPNIVHFYGALFGRGDVWIFMEVMDTSLDKFYKKVYQNKLSIKEPVLAKITLGVIKGLNYLKEKLSVIHRDVKPSNILANRQGQIKLCDFSVSGNLIDSLSKTKIGAKPYMAPEKVNPDGEQHFDVRSDIWSLGISLIELATGEFPYATWMTPFEQITQVVRGPSPSLPSNMGFSPDIQDFLRTCLIKDYHQRPKYPALLKHPFVVNADETNIADFICLILDQVGSS